MRLRHSPLSHLIAQLATALVAAAIAIAASVDHSSAQLIHDPPGAALRPDAGNDQPGQRPDAKRPERRQRGGHQRPAATMPTSPPAAPAPESDSDNNERLGRDPFAAMGGNSPFCRRAGLGARERANCRSSGALSHPQRADHYGLDIHIDTGVDNISGNFTAAIQNLAGWGWLTMLYLVKGVTLLLEWAFSLDLLGEAMSGVEQALTRLHRNVFGQAWFLAAISAAGLWAIWRGFVQRKTIQTATGLAATVALMVCALVIINDPAGTVGRASSLANQSSLGIVSGATTGSVSGSARGFAQAMTRVFDQAVLRPWCALEFSDVEFCLSNPRKVIPQDDLPNAPEIVQAWATSSTVAEMWLAFEPNGEDDVDQRNEIYEEWKDNDGERLQAVMRIQKEGATGTRLALLGLIVVGMVGMICLLAWIGLRLLGYGVLALVLVLIAPIALLLAALGDSGRQTFIAWAKRLLGALVAKAVYAVFLALVLVASAALAELDSLGFVASWVLQAVFSWTLFFKRNDIIQFASAPGLGPVEAQGGAGLLQRLYYGHQGLRSAKALAGGFGAVGIGGAVKAARPAQAGASGVQQRRAKTDKATTAAAEHNARDAARARVEQGLEQARETVERDDQTRASLARVDRSLCRYDERAELAKANDGQPPKPTNPEQALLGRRAALQAQRAPAPAVAAAREQVRHADTNRARTGSAVTAADERTQIAQRRRELAALPNSHPKNLKAAGIDPAAYRQASAAERQRLDRQAARSLGREAAELGAVPEPAAPSAAGEAPKPPKAPTATQLRQARRAIDPEQLREARRADNQARRAHRRAERARARLDPKARR